MARLSARQEKELRQAFRGQVRADPDRSRAGKRNNKSMKWFREKVQGAIEGRTKKNPMVGRIYTFIYSATTADQLEFWDQYPLSICIAKQRGQWWAINLHYLPPDFRANFLEELIVKYVDDKAKRSQRFREKTQLDIDWTRIKGFNSDVFEHALVSYVPDGFKTGIKEVDAREWYKAVGMPFQQFMSKKSGRKKRYSAQKVWSKL